MQFSLRRVYPCLKDRHPDINLLLHECRRSEIIHVAEENGVHIGLLPIRKEIRRTRPPPWSGSRKTAGTGAVGVIEDPEYLFSAPAIPWL